MLHSADISCLIIDISFMVDCTGQIPKQCTVWQQCSMAVNNTGCEVLSVVWRMLSSLTQCHLVW